MNSKPFFQPLCILPQPPPRTIQPLPHAPALSSSTSTDLPRPISFIRIVLVLVRVDVNWIARCDSGTQVVEGFDIKIEVRDINRWVDVDVNQITICFLVIC